MCARNATSFEKCDETMQGRWEKCGGFDEIV